VCSFTLDRDLPDFDGLSADLDIITPPPDDNPFGDVIPPWWKLATGDCRSGAVSASGDFTTFPQAVCLNPWLAGVPFGGVGISTHASGSPEDPVPNSTRIHVAYVTPSPIALSAGVRYLAFVIRIDTRKTVGAAACQGCANSACLHLGSIVVDGAAEGGRTIDQPIHNRVLTWQCAAGVTEGFPIVCSGPAMCVTPAITRTWGGIKSFYR
jgi:hypothetical protein